MHMTMINKRSASALLDFMKKLVQISWLIARTMTAIRPRVQ